jgi:hypothetical protein
MLEKLIIVVMVVVLSFGVVNAIWSFNNPKANSMTFFSHFNDAIHFRSLPEFQK